jgi:hypothetical protein
MKFLWFLMATEYFSKQYVCYIGPIITQTDMQIANSLKHSLISIGDFMFTQRNRI